MVSKVSVANFLHALVAVLTGNIVYFLLLPHLPEQARHVARHIDAGMVVDFLFCLIALAIIKTLARWKRESTSGRS